MDERIVKALRMLGLSPERVAKLGELVDSAKHRALTEGMITRVNTPVTGRKKPRRRIRVTYRPKGTGPTVAQEITTLETRLTRDLPPWQRRNYEARLDALLRAGKTPAETAAATLRGIDGRR